MWTIMVADIAKHDSLMFKIRFHFHVRISKMILYFQDALRSLMVAVKSFNELPNTGEDFNYYSSFPAYQEIMNVEGKRMLEMWDYYFWYFHILEHELYLLVEISIKCEGKIVRWI